jgi:hypothetical protein
MATVEGLNNQLMGAVAKRIFPQGRPHVRHELNGDISIGKILPGGEYKHRRYFHPDDALYDLKQRRKIIEACGKSLRLAAKTAVALGGVVVLKGIDDRSVKEVGLGFLTGTAITTGIEVGGVICNQTLESLDGRIALTTRESSSLVHQEQSPQKP